MRKFEQMWDDIPLLLKLVATIVIFTAISLIFNI